MTLRRPTTIDGMKENLSRFASEEGVERALAFQPKPTDVFISPFAKCGTTWMQQIVHGLRTGGDMEFDEITCVTPWLELAYDMGIDPEAPQKAEPRAFKSHLSWDDIPKGARYIIVMRDPMDALLSFYRFLGGWHFETGSISMEDFADYYFEREGGRNYWEHTASWWRVRGQDNVLILTYEDMKQDLPQAVRQVADFLDLPDHIDIAIKQAGFDFMNAHNTQFDDHVLRALRDPICGVPSDGQSTKVSTGQSGQGRPTISDTVAQSMQARWNETLGAEFGFKTYADLRAALSQS